MNWQEQYQLSALRYRLAGIGVELGALKLGLRLKAGYRPDQPRVPAGNPDGGQWTDGGITLVNGRRRGSGLVQIGARWFQATPAQQTRIDITLLAMRRAVNEAQRLDPKRRPRQQAYETVEGLIGANEATRFEAEVRTFEITGRLPQPGPFARDWIASPSSGRRLTNEQQKRLDLIGRLLGCHGCGSKTALTRNGHFVGDHWTSRALGTPTRIYPHCIACSSSQGGRLSAHKSRIRK